MGQQDIIDIERLREAVSEPIFVDAALPIEVRRAQTDLLISLRNAARFLVSLADQGGELWAHVPCSGCGGFHTGSTTPICGRLIDGGSRVRVWPKE